MAEARKHESRSPSEGGEDGGVIDDRGRRAPWWRELEVGLLLLLVVGIYFVRLSDLSIRGEESRRGMIAAEMLDTGQWIIPHQQGELYLAKPPLHFWTIAVVGLTRGAVDTVAVRLPSVLATLLTTLLVYAYARSFLGRLGALAAGACFATLGQILELGRMGETDALFTLFIAGSLLIWHWGWQAGWPPAWVWIAGYVLAALGALVKGPQAPLYFLASVSVFLWLSGQGRRLWCRSHLAGLAAFAGVLAAWLIPLGRHLNAVGWEKVGELWGQQLDSRFVDWGPLTLVEDLVTYPVQVVVGCLLPWSVLLLALTNRPVRRSILDAGSPARFVLVCLAVTFPMCWLVPGTQTRYYMPLYPCFAVLIGLLIERGCEAGPAEPLRALWKWFRLVLGALMPLGAVVVLAAVWLDPAESALAQPVGFGAVYAIASAITLATLWGSRAGRTLRQCQAGVLAIAAFVGLTYSGVVINARMNTSQDVAGAVARLKAELEDRMAPGQRLVSFGRAHHLFAYHYRDPIERHDWPRAPGDVREDVVYFCFVSHHQPGPLPFEWETVAVVSCDRNRHPEPQCKVIIGRRIGLSAP